MVLDILKEFFFPFSKTEMEMELLSLQRLRWVCIN